MNLSPELLDILTILAVGLGAFLIGLFLTSSRWKRKYQEAQIQSDQLVSQTTTLSADLNATKTKLTNLKATNKNLERASDENKTKLDVMNRNLQRAQQNSNTDELKNLKLQLDQEKTKTAKLQSELTTAEARPIISQPKVKKKKKKKSTKVKSVSSAKKSKSGKKKKLKKIMTRIGAGSTAQVDDLSVITGIGPEISSKLNDMGIVNYRQLSRLEDADLEVIDKALKFFPGRAYRNNWIGQAKVLADKGLN